MNSTTSQERQKDLFEQMFNLQTEIENPDTDYFVRLDAQSELVELNHEYTELCKVECVAIGEHNKRIVSDGGYDVCFSCGAKQ